MVETERLSAAEQGELLGIARQAIRAGLDGTRYAPPAPASERLREPRGAFVTLREEGRLRGCIGSMEGLEPLYRTVAGMARAAAFHDPRFPALAPDEWDRVRVEISALTPLRDASPEAVEPGRHGIVITQGGRRGVLLPQVATEYGWDREEFLARTCEKAGLPREAWRRGAHIQVFEAQVFGESAGG